MTRLLPKISYEKFGLLFDKIIRYQILAMVSTIIGLFVGILIVNTMGANPFSIENIVMEGFVGSYVSAIVMPGLLKLLRD